MTLGGRECVRIHRHKHKHIRRWGIFPEQPVCFDKCFASLPSILQPKCSHESVAQLRWHKANPPPLCLHFGLSASTCCKGLQSTASHQRRTEMNERETTQKRGFKDKRRAWRGLSVCAERCWGSYRASGSGKAQAFLEVKGRQHGTRSHQHASEKVLIRDCQRAVVYIVLQRRRLIHSFCFKLVWIVVQRILWATRFKLNCNHLGE